jgi:hypothetical protein
MSLALVGPTATGTAAVALQTLPGPLNDPLGALLAALVVVALVLFIGRYVMSVAWRIIKIAIVLVGLAWLVITVAPMLGL